jgi:hypothetical protein
MVERLGQRAKLGYRIIRQKQRGFQPRPDVLRDIPGAADLPRPLGFVQPQVHPQVRRL